MIIELHGSAAMRLQRQDAGIPSHLLGKRPIFDPNFLIKRVDSSRWTHQSVGVGWKRWRIFSFSIRWESDLKKSIEKNIEPSFL